MSRLLSVVLVFIVVGVSTTRLSSSQAAGSTLTVEEVIDRLQTSYERVEDFKAQFVQESTNRSLGRTLTASGEVAMKKPGKVRWEYRSPEPRLIVSDGRTLWIYSPEDRQVFVQGAAEVLSGISLNLLAGLGNLRRDFRIRAIAHAGTEASKIYLLELTPKKPEAALERLILEVDQETFLVEKAVFFDAYANTTTIAFQNLSINTGLPDSRFAFVPPPGVEVIEAPKPMGR